MIHVVPFNETFIKVQIDDLGIEQEFSEFFTFYTKGYKFSPAYRNGTWDGRIKLFNARNKNLYKGLIPIIIKFAKQNSYDLKIDPSLNFKDKTFDKVAFAAYCEDLNIASNSEPIGIREYQVEAAANALENTRKILISPTGSGKSLIIYSMIRYLLKETPEERILLIVPTTSLVEQMFRDFVDYSSLNGWKAEEYCQLLYSGKEKIFEKSIMISTWQSLHAMKKNDIRSFKRITDVTTVGIFDEAHTYKADEVRGTIEQFTKTIRRIGTTGTLDGSKVNELVLSGLFGSPFVVKTTRQLIDEGYLTDIKIKVIKLKYPAHLAKAMKGADYETEFNFIIGSEERNQFIVDLAEKCKGVTLITFSLVERHGKVLFDLLNKKFDGDRKVYFVSGQVAVEERERIRKVANNDPSCVIVASEKIFSTGINIPGITNIIFAVPRRSSILIRQTIGRGVRKFEGKDFMNLFDISDDLSVGNRKNVTLKSLDDRVAIYVKEEFEFTVSEVKLQEYYKSDGIEELSLS
jgi:superfamily II DNA or RNA helicase